MSEASDMTVPESAKSRQISFAPDDELFEIQPFFKDEKPDDVSAWPTLSSASWSKASSSGDPRGWLKANGYEGPPPSEDVPEDASIDPDLATLIACLRGSL